MIDVFTLQAEDGSALALTVITLQWVDRCLHAARRSPGLSVYGSRESCNGLIDVFTLQGDRRGGGWRVPQGVAMG